jgi:hypothetical protein
LFNPFEGLFGKAARRRLETGWQGVFRHLLLELMPVSELASHFDEQMGAPTKELYSMAGLVFLTDFFHWTVDEAVTAYLFHTDVQYALNIEPGAELSTRTVERYQRLFRNNDLAADVMHNVTVRLADVLELKVSRQRLDSTHVFSNMASFGRTRLMAVTVKRFLTQARKQALQAYESLPAELRERYQPVESQLFAKAKDVDSRAKNRQQVAEDLLFVIEHFADGPACSGYRTLLRVFAEQCEIVEDQVVVRKKTGGDCLQNPSDLEATYDGHKGPGYQVQLTETCGEENEVQLITAALPQTACERDENSVVPMLDQLERSQLLPDEMTADGQYGSDGNCQASALRGVELVAPVAGRPPETNDDALSIDDFAVDERTGIVDACPAGVVPSSVQRDAQAGLTIVEMPAENCAACPHQAACPIHRGRDGRFTVEFTDQAHRTAGRRREQETVVFQERYADRAGIESTNSGLKNRLHLGKLRVRGRGSVFRVIWHKVAGWNLLRAAASEKVRAVVAEAMARRLGLGGSAQLGQASTHSLALPTLSQIASRLFSALKPSPVVFPAVSPVHAI